MKARDLMTREVQTCSQDDSLARAAQIMWDADVGCVVVIDAGQKPVGMITDRDIAMAAYMRNVPLSDVRVSSAMARDVVTCSANTALGALEATMSQAQIRRVPVVDTFGKLVGIVALGDIARSAQSSPIRLKEIPGLARTLAGITERRHPEASAPH
jgi:CBS-domain-containing membrane protein